jgi:hypothetical protein
MDNDRYYLGLQAIYDVRRRSSNDRLSSALILAGVRRSGLRRTPLTRCRNELKAQAHAPRRNSNSGTS